MNSATLTQTYNNQPGSVFKEIGALWERRKWLAVLTFLVPFAVIVSMSTALPNFYRAEVTVLMAPDNSEKSKPIELGELESMLQVLSAEILSRAQLQEVIVDNDLYSELRQTNSIEKAIERMRKDIRIAPKPVEQNWNQGATMAFNLSYQGWEPDTVSKMANIIATLFVKENDKLRQREAVNKPVSETTNMIAQLKQQLAELRTRFSAQYPDVIRINAEIAALERQRGKTELEKKPLSIGNAQTTKLHNGRQLRIVEPAIAPTEPVAPIRIRLMIMALVFSLGVAGAATFLAEQLDTSFSRMEDLSSFTDVPVLTAIPQITTRADFWWRLLRQSVGTILVGTILTLVVWASYLMGESGDQLVWMLAQRGI